MSDEVYKSNYMHDDWNSEFYWIAKPASWCDTAPLIQEYRELYAELDNVAFNGDEEWVIRRLTSIKKELANRGIHLSEDAISIA